jgi:hypothetical protein
MAQYRNREFIGQKMATGQRHMEEFYDNNITASKTHTKLFRHFFAINADGGIWGSIIHVEPVRRLYWPGTGNKY